MYQYIEGQSKNTIFERKSQIVWPYFTPEATYTTPEDLNTCMVTFHKDNDEIISRPNSLGLSKSYVLR